MHATTHEAVERCLQEAAVEAASDRRLLQRVPFFRPVTLTEHGGDGTTAQAFSRDISPGGIGLLHRMPLASDRVTLEIPFTRRRQLTVTTQVRWCAPAGAGFYFSGGEFAPLSVRQNASLLSTLVKAELNQRLQDRYPFFRPVAINVKGHGNTEVSAFSRDICAGGIGLLHNMPLETGRVVLTIPSTAGDQLDISTEIRWCSAVGEGWYVSGGRFSTLLFEEVPVRLL